MISYKDLIYCALLVATTGIGFSIGRHQANTAIQEQLNIAQSLVNSSIVEIRKLDSLLDDWLSNEYTPRPPKQIRTSESESEG